MNNFKSALARAVFAAVFVLSGCASLETQFEGGDILAELHDSSQSGE